VLSQHIVDGLSADMSTDSPRTLGVSPNTLDLIAAFARAEPTVLLAAHDPLAEQRLAERITVTTD
jgi:hypothetical protein